MVLQLFSKLLSVHLECQLCASRTAWLLNHFQLRHTFSLGRVCPAAEFAALREKRYNCQTGHPCPGVHTSQPDHPQSAGKGKIWPSPWKIDANWFQRNFSCSCIDSFIALFMKCLLVSTICPASAQSCGHNSEE